MQSGDRYSFSLPQHPEKKLDLLRYLRNLPEPRLHSLNSKQSPTYDLCLDMDDVQTSPLAHRAPDPYDGAQITNVKGCSYVIFPELTTSESSIEAQLLQTQFLSWWTLTQWAQDAQRNPDSSGSEGRQARETRLSSYWKHKNPKRNWENYRQVAEKQTGKPKAQCMLCQGVFNHPRATGQGSGGMKRHMENHILMTTDNPQSSSQSTQQLRLDQCTPVRKRP
jgi:hypothetical protein